MHHVIGHAISRCFLGAQLTAMFSFQACQHRGREWAALAAAKRSMPLTPLGRIPFDVCGSGKVSEALHRPAVCGVANGLSCTSMQWHALGLEAQRAWELGRQDKTRFKCPSQPPAISSPAYSVHSLEHGPSNGPNKQVSCTASQVM